MRGEQAVLGVSTAWNAARCGGLASAIREILELGVGVVEAAAPTAARDVGAAAAVLAESRARCLSVAFPLLGQPAGQDMPDLAAEDDVVRGRALGAVAATVEAAARLSAKVLVIPGAAVTVPDGAGRQAAFERAFEAGAAEAAELRTTLLAERDRHREAAVERFCRSLFAILNGAPGLRIAVAPSAGLLSLPNHEELGWLFSDLKSDAVGFWHDTAVAGVREATGGEGAETWSDTYGDRSMGCYISDFSGLTIGLPPGSGRLDWALVSGMLSPRIPKMLKLQPASSRLAVREGLKIVGSL